MSKNLKVMVVDDEAIVGKRLKPALEKEGYDVEVFADGEGAINCLGEQAFDIVVTDIRMGPVDGMQLLEHVVARSSRTKVILITGYATVELAREALLKGAYDFIAKPFRPADLRAVIRKAARELKGQPQPLAEEV